MWIVLPSARGLVCVWRVVGGAVEAAGWFGVAMILDFSWLPPEINSARIYAGAGSGPLFMAAAVAETLTPFSVPPLDLAGLASQAGAQLTGMATSVSAALSPIAEGAVEGVPAVVAAAQSVAAGLPVDAALQVGQAAAYPASMLIGPMMQLAQMGTTANTAGLAGAEAAGLAAADVPTFAGDIASGTGLGGAGGLGAGMSAELGKARLVGAMSVPPTWEGSVPARMASSAMAGLGAMPAEVPAAGGPMGMMPMPMGMGGAGAGMPAGMMGRGGANPHVVQARPSVVPRVGIG